MSTRPCQKMGAKNGVTWHKKRVPREVGKGEVEQREKGKKEGGNGGRRMGRWIR